MAKLTIPIVVAWCATLSSAYAQEVSTEAACLSTLRKVVGRLETIEAGLTGAAQACTAARDAAVTAAIATKDAELSQLRSSNAQMISQAQSRESDLANLKDALGRLEPVKGGLDAERKRTTELEQRISAMRTENAEAAARTAEAERRLRAITDEIDAAVVSRVREALNGPLAGCEARPEVTASAGVVTVSGRLMKADDARRRITDAVRLVPGASARTEDLLKIDVCGHPIGDGWVVEGAGDGLHRYGFNEIPPDSFDRMPDGSPDICASLGAALERAGGSKDDTRSAFWVKRPGSARLLAFCAPPSGDGAWAYNITGLNQVRGLLVQRSQ